MTIKDIAEKAGVSVATVSHVINRTRYVSDELRNKVIRVMRELDYQPNLMAGSLRRKKTRTVGLIIPDNANPVYAELAKAIEEILFGLDLTLMLCNSDHDLNKELKYIKALRSKQVDGLIIIPASARGDHIDKLVQNGLPVVVLDRPLPGSRADSVLIDHHQGIFAAAEFLIRLGYERIGYIDKKYDLPHKFTRLEAFRKALGNHGVRFSKTYYRATGVALEDGARAMTSLLEEEPRLQAVLCFDDIIAMGALRAITDRGLSVPSDISVIGFDDMPLCQYTVPRLTTLHYPRAAMAERACRFLLDRIAGQGAEEKNLTILPVRLVLRESTPADVGTIGNPGVMDSCGT